jgi:hypothetical protein
MLPNKYTNLSTRDSMFSSQVCIRRNGKYALHFPESAESKNLVANTSKNTSSTCASILKTIFIKREVSSLG